MTVYVFLHDAVAPQYGAVRAAGPRSFVSKNVGKKAAHEERRMMWWSRSGWLIVLCMGCGGGDRRPPPPVAIQASPAPGPGAPAVGSVDAARAAHQRAADAYGRADYAGARAAWEEALRYDPTATRLLINIANAAQKEGNLAAACAAVRRARAAALPPDEIQAIEARLGTRC